MNSWNYNNPRHVEEALKYYYSLPSDDEDSETEADKAARNELNGTKYYI